MATHDDDILDFDFVDDATQEQAAPRRQPDGGADAPARRPRVSRPSLPRPRSATPLLRLIGLIAFAILIVVLLSIWAQGCSADKKRSDYEAYLADIGDIGSASAKLGEDLASLLTTAGLTQKTLEQRLGGIAQAQTADVERARALDAPGPLNPAHEHAVEALEFRASGLQGLLQTFKDTAGAKEAGVAGQRLAVQTNRLLASDVVWADLFRAQATQTAIAEDVAGLSAPPSVFSKSPVLFRAESLAQIWQRIHGASTGGTATPAGLHGSALGPVRALPAGIQLSQQSETKVQLDTQLAFEVSVQNSGESQEVGIEVTLTIPQQPTKIVKKGRIDFIDPSQTKTITFADLPELAPGESTTIIVEIAPVPGETNTSNNTYEYPVIFSL
ncbi:MAG: CARDB domain-containing protein [Gaiella sp.]